MVAKISRVGVDSLRLHAMIMLPQHIPLRRFARAIASCIDAQLPCDEGVQGARADVAHVIALRPPIHLNDITLQARPVGMWLWVWCA